MADLFLCWHGTADLDLDRFAKQNEPEQARRLSTEIERGARVLESWVLSSGGSMVVENGTSGQAKLPADKLDELVEVLERYEKATDSRISVGVGFESSEAAMALKVAEARGGTPAVVLFNDSVADEAHELEHSKEETDLGSLMPEEDAALEDNAVEPDGGVESGLAKAQFNDPGEAGEASKVANGQASPMAAQPSAPSPLTPGSPQQPQDGQQGAAAPQAAQQPPDGAQLKQSVAAVLQQVKQNLPDIQKLQQSSPAAYQAIMGLVDAFLAVAEARFGQSGSAAPQPMQKAEKEGSKEESKSPEQVSAPECGMHGLKNPCSSCAAQDRMGNNPHFHPLAVVKKTDHPMHAMTPGKRHELNLPVGSNRGGRVKIIHQDGRQGWVSVRAGQILSVDGHSISSRNPGGR